MQDLALDRIRLAADLRGALDRDQMALHYQPIIDCQSEEVVGVEAFLRWQHPRRGLLKPDQFMRIAEETGLIVSLGEWIMRTACAQAKAWLDAGLSPGRISVNVSSRQCRQGSWLEVVEWALRDAGLPAELLTLEITESTLLKGKDFRVAMHVLKEMGVNLSVDDFGTGYSSISYLKQFPVDTVKIDRTFIGEAISDPDHTLLIEAIIAMAHGLKIKTVAVGVESVEQIEFLRARQCDYLQGFYFAEPQAAEDFEAYLRAKAAAPAEGSFSA
jgi:EAL domain-containing protein (putative c-di-GMP-specific phosphodiesterase class I)